MKKTNQQILEKAIQKAIDGGWKPLKGFDKNTTISVGQWQGQKAVEIAILYPAGERELRWVRELEGIIFNHDFARALWGEKPEYGIKRYGDTEGVRRQDAGEFIPWKHHLQQMVIAEDPIKYLGENL